jgi:hypothetical protein
MPLPERQLLGAVGEREKRANQSPMPTRQRHQDAHQVHGPFGITDLHRTTGCPPLGVRQLNGVDVTRYDVMPGSQLKRSVAR